MALLQGIASLLFREAVMLFLRRNRLNGFFPATCLMVKTVGY
jgi:hypothetical protein